MGSPHSRARLNPRHQLMVRAKIQASQIINRLTACVMGKVELSPAQVQAARILLDKSVPTLSSVDATISGETQLKLTVVTGVPERES